MESCVLCGAHALSKGSALKPRLCCVVEFWSREVAVAAMAVSVALGMLWVLLSDSSSCLAGRLGGL